MFGYPYGSGATPLMGVAMHTGTRAVPAWEPGDVLITNDPYSTGGMVMHLNDIYLFRPVFVDGELLCFAWSFIHCTDVGGYAPAASTCRIRSVPGGAAVAAGKTVPPRKAK
jgi:N-methylhydantoinase B